MSDWDGRLGAFDLETTGVDVDSSRIVSACIAVLDSDGSVLERWEWIADPGSEIPAASTAVHGITTEHAQRFGRPAPEVIAEITQTLRTLFALGLPVAIYNAPFDLTLLDRECRRNRIPPIEDPSPVLDPLVIDRAVEPDRPTKRTLRLSAERYGIPLDGAHDAVQDAIAAGRIAQELSRRHPDLLAASFTELHRRQRDWYAEQAIEYQEYVRTVKGDENYVASGLWPFKPADDPRIFEDTQPIPIPAPRPSATVPSFDFTGTIPLALEAPVRQGDAADDLPVAPPNRRVHVAAAIITDPAGRSLVVRKHGSTVFMQAGGKIERGESAIAALMRKLDEELGLAVDVGRTEFLGSFEAEAAHESGSTVRAEVFALTASEDLVARAEIAEIRWLDPDEDVDVELAPLTRDVLLPLWAARRPN